MAYHQAEGNSPSTAYEIRQAKHAIAIISYTFTETAMDADLY